MSDSIAAQLFPKLNGHQNQLLYLILTEKCEPKNLFVDTNLDYKTHQKREDMANVVQVMVRFYEEYSAKTSQRLKLIDAYLLYILLTGVIQFLYCCLVGTF
ncbi:unnamed protein product, partial [Oppiella nova]